MKKNDVDGASDDHESIPLQPNRRPEWMRIAAIALACATVAGLGVAAVYEWAGDGGPRIVAFDRPDAVPATPAEPPTYDSAYAATAAALSERLGLTPAPADDAFWRSPEQPPAPAATGAAAKDSLPDVDSMVAALERRLAASPGDADGWRMLGWSHQRLGRLERAVDAYQRALALAPNDARTMAGLGEAMVERDGGKVSDEALGLFRRASAADPTVEAARYFIGQRKRQDGDSAGAIEDWLALLAAAPPGADWAAGLEQQVRDAAAEAGVDLTGRLPAQ